MPTRSFDREALSKKEIFKATKEVANRRIINGKLVTETNSKEFKLQNAVKILKENGSGFNNMPKVEFGDNISAGYYILESVGITPVGVLTEKLSFEPSSYSTKTNPTTNYSTGTETEKLRQKLISPTKSFSSDESNPFYNLDRGPSRIRFEAIKSIKETREVFDLHDQQTT